MKDFRFVVQAEYVSLPEALAEGWMDAICTAVRMAVAQSPARPQGVELQQQSKSRCSQMHRPSLPGAVPCGAAISGGLENGA